MKNLFHQAEAKGTAIDTSDFEHGTGFYLMKDLHYTWLTFYNQKTNMFCLIEDVNVVPREIIELFGKDNPSQEQPIIAETDKVSVSESFILKAMAIARGKVYDIELNNTTD